MTTTANIRQPDKSARAPKLSLARKVSAVVIGLWRFVRRLGKRPFVCYFWHIGWDCYSLGVHLCTRDPNIEIHLPFGFVRIGWVAPGYRKYPSKQLYGWDAR